MSLLCYFNVGRHVFNWQDYLELINSDFFRLASTKAKTERGIYVKHFKNIPMADMEIVLVSILATAFSWYLLL